MSAAPSVDAESRERIAEIADLLAKSLQRLAVQQSSEESAILGESSLHISPVQSGHASPCSVEIADG